MARTSLFDRVRGLLAADPSLPRQGGREGAPLTRRALLGACMAGLGSALTPSAARALCAAPARTQPRVAIIGAGLAGLSCAYRLRQAGVHATVYEATRRVGGRTSSLRGLGPDRQVIELGGELIDSGDVHLHNLADELDIVLLDRAAAARGRAVGEIFVVDGKRVPDALIRGQLDAVRPALRALAAQADARDPAFDLAVYDALNRQSMGAWLDAHVTDAPQLRAVLESAYRGEFGRELDAQSALNLVFMLGGAAVDAPGLFGDSDERYQARGGNQTFCDALSTRLPDTVKLGHALTRVRGAPRRGYTLQFRTASGPSVAQAEVLIFALPFATLRRVDLTDLPLSADKRRAVAELSYGTNAKVAGRFATRPWSTLHGALGSLTSDANWQQAWDSSLAQAGESGILTNFLGGAQGLACVGASAEQWYTGTFLRGVERVLPGVAAGYVRGSAVRMHWPSAPYARGSYACYAPGQWDLYGTEGATEGEGTLLFCGEHTSLERAGFMEGAAETGELAAAALLAALGRPCSARHAFSMRLARALPQPALGASIAPGTFLARCDARARALAALWHEGDARRAG
ncbi:MAG: NAD(P)/FAD-dependent oxidoreductase [Polyangiales bacterium]